ncbi:magnesium-translocating P-type ATPase [Verminephrobacter eiseniae]|uniref:magnesium-translocating P-type ATPase n=1 Tax=Verminephrobacter eiseniae TaxID=364317 RepID=UPI002238255B|nr:magnesium-translocating P-type ATPase [Verminephrobacter eiseniae]MCW5235864.1 magnesium-translocating P-type ATPase [Verminephrobacter eiseniae]
MNLDLLKAAFVGFIRARGIEHHFRRLGRDMFRSAPLAREVPQTIAHRLVCASQTKPDALLRQLGTRPGGLTGQEADAIRAAVGPNAVEHEKPLTWRAHLWHGYKNPFNLLLTALAAVSYFTADMKAAMVIGAMVISSTLMRFIQESRSNGAADKLKAMVSNTATVSRCGAAQDSAEQAPRHVDASPHFRGSRRIELPIEELVPGDIVQLSAGDMIPADLRLLSAKDLFVSQAAMTGESLPVEKFAEHRGSDAGNPLELDNLCFMGTSVISGAAAAVVLTTGNRTYFGALAERVTAADRTPTAFQSGVNQVSWLLIRFMLVMTPIVFFINGFTKGDWIEAFLFGLSIAVGLTPEMLPMIVTSTLAKGAVALSRKKVIVKRLDAIQNLGAMDMLCTDKTGTLTQDEIFLKRHTGILGAPNDEVLQYAYLNSYYQSGLKNLLDTAVLEHAELQREMALASAYRKVDEIPFDFQRRRMSVVVSEREDRHELICKGAVEEIVSVCTHARNGGAIVPFTPQLLAEISATTASLNSEGLRVVAVAAKDLPPTKETYGVADESGLVLIGYIAFLDPPKESTAPALAALRAHGVAVKILTGDNELVSAKICREVGLEIQGLLLGAHLEKMTDAELALAVEKTTVFAKLRPAHKERIVRVLHDEGHVVGFMGDGINDAPALRAADVGISVDTAVDIAKDAADLILLEKSLMVLEAGVLEGRKTFANMLKYIKMTASSNFGNVLSVLVASAFLPFLPMLPLHLLVQNLLYDASQIPIPFDNVDKEFIEKPQRWNPGDIGRFMVFFGPVSSVFDISTFALMWYVFGANSPDRQTLFQSGWFIEGLLSQTLIVHMIRTRRIAFLQSRASWPLMGMTLVIMAIGIIVPMSPLASYFELQALPPGYFPWLLVILIAYGALIQAMKKCYTRRYGWQ